MHRFQQLIVAFGLAAVLALGAASFTAAAPNPSGTGQPSVECDEDGLGSGPAGFATDGFAQAQSVYAGSEGSASASHSGSSHAVSQYDVACYQLTVNQS